MATPRTDQEVLLANLTKAITSLDTGTKQSTQTDKTGKVEDTAHVTGDVGVFMLAVRNDAADCTAHDGDYVALTTNHDGAVYTEDPSTHVDDAAFTLGTSKGTMMMGFAGTQSVNANDAGAIAMDTDGAMHVAGTDLDLIASAVKAEDAAHVSGDKGIMAFAVRKDVADCLAADGDYQPMQTDVIGAIRTQNTFGTWGTILVNDTTAVTCGVSGRDFVAIYMLTNTVFASGAGGLTSKTDQLYLDDTFTSTDIDADAGTAIDGITFPAGMTLYGRYAGFTLASGSVIAYVG